MTWDISDRSRGEERGCKSYTYDNVRWRKAKSEVGNVTLGGKKKEKMLRKQHKL